MLILRICILSWWPFFTNWWNRFRFRYCFFLIIL